MHKQAFLLGYMQKAALEVAGDTVNPREAASTAAQRLLKLSKMTGKVPEQISPLLKVNPAKAGEAAQALVDDHDVKPALNMAKEKMLDILQYAIMQTPVAWPAVGVAAAGGLTYNAMAESDRARQLANMPNDEYKWQPEVEQEQQKMTVRQKLTQRPGPEYVAPPKPPFTSMPQAEASGQKDISFTPATMSDAYADWKQSQTPQALAQK